jgi:flagellar hook-associated protein 2
MGSITLTGYNNIDWSTILDAVMQQERQPVTLLETQKSTLSAQASAFSTLASRLSSLQSAADDLKDKSAFQASAATVSDSTRISFSSGSTAAKGTYQITVNALAQAQVSLSNGLADADTTVVATGGTISFGAGRDVTITGPVTLNQLASAINSSDTAGVAASVVKNASGYQLMITGHETGAAAGFTTSAAGLTGGATPLTFTQPQTAQDAEITLNGVTVTSATNTFDSAIQGASFTVLKKDTENPIVVTINASNDSLKSLVQKLVTAYNDTMKFIDAQQDAATKGETNNIGRDALVRSLRRQLTGDLFATNTAGGGALKSLAEAGLTLSRTGELSLDSARFDEALKNGRIDVQKLFFGTDGSDGVFGKFEASIDQFTKAGGLLPSQQKRITEQTSKIAARIDDMEERLEVRRAALLKEYVAADQLIAQLKAQGNQLSAAASSWA